jgi:hypothetical protein
VPFLLPGQRRRPDIGPAKISDHFFRHLVGVFVDVFDRQSLEFVVVPNYPSAALAGLF